MYMCLNQNHSAGWMDGWMGNTILAALCWLYILCIFRDGLMYDFVCVLMYMFVEHSVMLCSVMFILILNKK